MSNHHYLLSTERIVCNSTNAENFLAPFFFKLNVKFLYLNQVAESNMQYQSRLEELEKSVKDYEGKFSHHQEVLDSTIQKDKAQIDKLQEEKAMLEVSGRGQKGGVYWGWIKDFLRNLFDCLLERN